MGWQRIWKFGGSWFYSPLASAVSEPGLEEVETYVSYPQNTVTHFIATRPILDLCLAAYQCPGERVSWRWWEQDNLDLEDMQAAARVAGMEAEKDVNYKY